MARPVGRKDLGCRAVLVSPAITADWVRQLGEAMRHARVAAGISADEVGAALGVSGDAVMTWEQGRILGRLGRGMAVGRLREYAAAIGVSVEALLP